VRLLLLELCHPGAGFQQLKPLFRQFQQAGKDLVNNMKQEYIAEIKVGDKIVSREQLIDEVIENENMELGYCQQVNRKKHRKQDDLFSLQEERYQQPQVDIDANDQADMKKGRVQVVDGFSVAR
jgi:hypothetical protein